MEKFGNAMANVAIVFVWAMGVGAMGVIIAGVILFVWMWAQL